MTCLVALDLGSNSFRLLKAEPLETPPYYRPIRMERIIVRMGESVSETGKFSDAAIRRGMEALEGFKKIIDDCPYRAVATGVFRESMNSKEFIRNVRYNLMLNIEIITPEEEAFLSYRSALNEIGYDDKALFMDIGGGSVEIALMSDRGFVFESIPWGIVKLWDKFLPGMPADMIKVKEMEQFLVTKINEVYNKFSEYHFKDVVITGGTVTTLIMLELGLREYKREILNGYIVKRSLVEKWYKTISLMGFEKRKNLPGMERGREDLIVTGLLIMRVFMDIFKVEKSYNSEGWLLEGVLLSLKERRKNA